MRAGSGAARNRLSRMPPQAAIIAVLAMAGLSSSFMMTMVVPIQSRLPELLHTSRENTAWVVTATLLASAVFTPISGRLGDMYGKRRVVLVLMLMMVTGSVVAATSHEIVGIVVGRALQGTAIGVVPLGIAILRDVLHENRVPSAIALMSATLGVGGALGMPLSALVTETADWHLVFWLSAALGIAVFGLVLWVVPVSVLRTGGRFDYVGAVGLGVGLTAILIALSRGADWGWLSPAVIACALGGLAVLAVWGWYELRVKTPLLNLRLAARGPVLLTNLASIGMGFGLFSSQVMYPQLLEQSESTGVGFGLSLLAASFVVMPSGIVMILLSPFSGRLAGKFGPKTVLVLGAAALVASYGWTLLTATEVWHVLVANLLVGVGIGFGFASAPMLIMRSVPQHETGESNGLNTLFRSLGTSTASAVIGAVLAAYSVDVDGTTAPTASGYHLGFLIGMSVAVCALVLALLIPRARDPHERHPSLPD